jgi:hypothetical protein
MPRLVIDHPGEGSRVLELLGDRPISIGRAKSSTVVLDCEGVSRLHAIVHSTADGKWQITDRDSSNGVKINGAKTKEATLRPNDEIVVGEYKIRFEDSASREVVTYGTPELPQRVARVLSQSVYGGSAMPVEAVGAAATSEAPPPANGKERLRAPDHENRLLKLVDHVNSVLGERNTLEELTQGILDLVLEIDGGERAYAMLLDEASMARGDFRKGGYGFLPAVIRYRTDRKGSPNQNAPQLVISQSIIRQVMQAGLPRLVSDAKADARLASSSSIALAGIQSAMCAPLGIGDRTRGLLYVDNLSRRGMFTVEDLNVFTVIAGQSGLAIDRVRGRSETVEQRQ